MRGVRGLALAAATTLALTACSGGDGGGGDDAGSGDESGGTAIVTANGSEPENPLIPTNTNEVGGARIINSIFSGLVYYKADGTPVNDLAESIETEDSKTFTVKLKEGAKFSDGSPVTASSFVDAWNYGAYGPNAHKSSYYFALIEGYDEVSAEDSTVKELSGLKVIDDQTFTITLSQQAADFPLRLGYSAFYPLPEAAFEDMEAFGENPIGNGPYKLAGEGAWKHDQRIDLVANETYEGPREAKNDGLSFIFYASLDAAYTELQQGQLDVLDQIPDGALTTFEADLGERAVNKPAAIFQDFTIPENLPHFSGEEGRLRRAAISHTIDREKITEAIFQGTRTPAKDFTSPVVPGYSPDIPGNDVLDYDPEKAKELWAQADAISPWDGSFLLAYNSDGPHQAWVDAVTNSLRQTLGIQAEAKPYPTFSQFLDDRTARNVGGAFRSGWQADYPSAMNFLADIHVTGASGNDGDYSNPEFDALIAKAAATEDQDEQQAILKEAQEILFKDLPHVPLWYQNVSGGYSENVANVDFGWDSVPIYDQIEKK
ncbi:ABC transporter substrate-binding protein [Kineococcus xinjiangensis]